MRKNKEATTTRKKHKGLKITLLVIALLLVTAIAGTAFMFRNEIAIISTVQKVDCENPYYTMEFKDGYHLDEILEKDITSDQELADVLIQYISHGFSSSTSKEKDSHIGCSTLTCKNKDGNILWGRNFDWYYSAPIVVRSTPKGGYASISTCEFTNLSGNDDDLPEGIKNKMLAIGAYFVPMDGINEKGLCVAELEINEGGQERVDTGKKHLTVTLAIRMLLDKAATVDEAIELLNQYDICPTGGISSHMSISDRTGKAVVAEFMNGKVEVTETNVVTNFNIKNGDITAGGESAERRYTVLKNAYEKSGGVMTVDELVAALKDASQQTGEWKTRWTVVYEDSGEDTGEIKATFYREGDYENGSPISLH